MSSKDDFTELWSLVQELSELSERLQKASDRAIQVLSPRIEQREEEDDA